MRLISLFILIILISGCATVTDKKDILMDMRENVVVLPFENYTETPLSGLRASSIIEGVMRVRGFNVKDRFWEQEEKDIEYSEIRGLIKEAEGLGIKYVVVGYVNEWRYKTGIDGEPAVSLTIQFYDTHQKDFVWSSVGAKTGWGHESIGTVAQKLINGLLDGIKQR